MNAQTNTLGSVLLVEDNAFSREGLAQYLQLMGYDTFEAGDMDTAVALAAVHRPNAAVVDIVIPTTLFGNAESHLSVGLDLVRLLKKNYPTLGVVIFSAHDDRGPDVWGMVRDGMSGVAYLVKGTRAERITEALELVMSGQVVIDSELAQSRNQFVNELLALLSPQERVLVEKAADRFPTLTPREMDVAWRIAGSHTNFSIAQALNLKPKTVETHIASIYGKLDLNAADGLSPRLRKSTLLAKVCILYYFLTRNS